MNKFDLDNNLEAFEAFVRFCAEVEIAGDTDLAECQYWVFEKGYKAAMQNAKNYNSQAKEATPMLKSA